MVKAIRVLRLFVLIVFLFIVATGCKTVERKKGFDMMKEIADVDLDTAKKPIYLTGTIPIDSVNVDLLATDIHRHDISKYPKEVVLYARVYDSLGHFVTNMAKPYLKDTTANYWKGLQETLGKKIVKGPIKIDSFTVREYGANDSIPYNIALTVDYSGSMAAVLETIFEGTEIFVDMKMKYDRIAISSFNKDYFPKVPLTKDKDSILQIYRTTKNQGIGAFSAPNQAIWESMKVFEGTDSTTPRVLVIFTDGDDNYSKTKVGDLIERAKRDKIFIFTVAFGYSQDKNLRQIAEYTGGKFYKAYTKEELIAIFRDIYMSLRYFYKITYKAPEYWGYHYVETFINVPGREDTLVADTWYDASDLFDWDDLGDAFSRPILFDFDSAVVKEESYWVLDEIADKLLSLPRVKLEIQGHTDNIGEIEYNQKLSEKRAEAVRESLIKRGVEANRLRSRGFGESKPLAPNDTEEGRAKNRRTQFVIIAK
ncbi:VWA domain-containing protein [Bacteroidetes/Chlorobi group bacterium ChocPot_Mid]|nr:MAG: VWA domain-containing protein [Bacteroidetes/Chlorobi group bacterium ChocPot_Mid]